MNIQIFGLRKSFDTKKAERWFKERRIKYQYIDLANKGLSAGEYRSVRAADLGALLPTELADTLRAGLRAYERKIAGYTAPEAILTGLETRTSSPVRLKREENLECAQLAGLYPCGEGAGYAGGIMSAAVDGLRVARAIISRYSPAEG